MGRQGSTLLFLGFGAVLACMAGLFYVGFDLLEATRDARAMDQVLDDKVRAASRMRDAISKRAFSLAYVTVLEDYFARDEERLRHADLANEFMAAREHLFQLGLDGEESAALEEVKEQIQKTQPVVDSAMDLAVEGERGPGLEQAMTIARRSQANLLKAVDGFVEHLDAHARARAEAVERNLSAARNEMTVLGATAFLSSFLIGLLVMRREASAKSRLLREIADRTAAEEQVRDLNSNLVARVARRTQELRESEGRSRAIVETAVDGIVTIDEAGLILTLNPAVERMFGYEASEVLGQNVSMLMPEPHHSNHDGYLERYLSSGEPHIIGFGGREVEGRRRDGSVFPLSLSVSEMREGDKRLFVGILADISARKKAEAEVLAEKARAERYLDVAEALFVELDREGRIVRLNRQGCEILGCDPEKVIGRVWFDCAVVEDERDYTRAVFADLMSGSKTAPRHLESTVLTVSGQHRHIAWNTEVLTDETGTPTGTLSSGQDVTWYHHQEEHLLQAKNDAELANRAKTEFLANMSHELRTPLNAIIGFSDLIRTEALGADDGKLYRSYIEDIHTSGQHLLSLVNDILDVSRIEAGRFEIHEEDVPFCAVARAALRLVEPRARERGVRLSASLPDNLPMLWADRRLVKQMLLNLLSNAVKFSHKHGTVHLEATHDQAGLRVAVSDEGIGMMPEDIPKALSPFVQVGRGTFAGHEGTGLGLPLTKGQIEAHGGTFTLESAPKKGTTATLLFPASRLRRGETAENCRKSEATAIDPIPQNE